MYVRPDAHTTSWDFCGAGTALDGRFFRSRPDEIYESLHQSQAVFASLVEKILESVVGKID